MERPWEKKIQNKSINPYLNHGKLNPKHITYTNNLETFNKFSLSDIQTFNISIHSEIVEINIPFSSSIQCKIPHYIYNVYTNQEHELCQMSR